MADLRAVAQRRMEARGMSLRALARTVHHDPSYLSKALDATRLWQRDMYEHYQLSGGSPTKAAL